MWSRFVGILFLFLHQNWTRDYGVGAQDDADACSQEELTLIFGDINDFQRIGTGTSDTTTTTTNSCTEDITSNTVTTETVSSTVPGVGTPPSTHTSPTIKETTLTPTTEVPIPLSTFPTARGITARDSTGTTPDVTSTTETLTHATTHPPTGRCEIHGENGKCFWVVSSKDERITFNASVNICSEQKGVIANISTMQEYDDLVKHISHPHSEAKAWVGHSYDSTEKKVHGTYVKWSKDCPQPGSDRTRIYLWVSNNEKEVGDEGMVNEDPRRQVGTDVVCQEKLHIG